MAEASKLFDKSGGTSSGNKQDAVNGAAMTVMKLLVQSKFSGGTTGGGSSGGLGGLMGLVRVDQRLLPALLIDVHAGIEVHVSNYDGARQNERHGRTVPFNSVVTFYTGG